MAKTASPLHTKRVPKSVSEPTQAAEAAATLAESVAEPEPAPAAKKTKPAAKKAVAAKKVKSAAGKAKDVAAEAAPVAAADAVAAKPAKAHKPKLVRDSFTIPKDEYQALDALKTRALGLEQHVRKSELLRAGIQALSTMSDRAFLKAIAAVPTLKTGRPKIG